jgi:hypothetical protein
MIKPASCDISQFWQAGMDVPVSRCNPTRISLKKTSNKTKAARCPVDGRLRLEAVLAVAGWLYSSHGFNYGSSAGEPPLFSASFCKFSRKV